MRKLIILAGIIVTMLALPACRTSKFSNRQKAQLAVEEQSDFKSNLRQDSYYGRSTSISDSSGQHYQLTIFPVDSFRFSLQNGFAGKATKVLVTGSGEQMMRLTDTSGFSGSLNSQSAMKMRKDRTAKRQENSSLVEKPEVGWKSICAGLIAGMLVFGLWRKLHQS